MSRPEYSPTQRYERRTNHLIMTGATFAALVFPYLISRQTDPIRPDSATYELSEQYVPDMSTLAPGSRPTIPTGSNTEELLSGLAHHAVDRYEIERDRVRQTRQEYAICTLLSVASGLGAMYDNLRLRRQRLLPRASTTSD